VSVLNTPLESLSGITPRKLTLLRKEYGVNTLGALLKCYPFRYIDRTQIHSIRDLSEEMPLVQVVGMLSEIKLIGKGNKQRLSARLTDATGSVELIWFQGIKWVEGKLSTSHPILAFGKPSLYNQRYSIAHPELELYSPEKAAAAAMFQPMYSTSETMKRAWLDSKGVGQIMQQAIRICQGKIEETIPESIKQRFGLFSLGDAFNMIHFPANQVALEGARKRLIFEELFFLQLKLIQRYNYQKTSLKGFAFESIGEYFNGFYKDKLPFELTNAQKRVLKEIRADVARPIQMNRLIQGDVGSGKTIVAFMSMLMAIDNGFQACLMAPTEILARQHFEQLEKLGNAIGLEVRILTGSSKTKARRELHEGIETGRVHILIGTHAVLEEKVVFQNLGMVVIDEQHRFGVAQRARLWVKNTLPPHVLIMSATPIPRTLAMTLYGDLDVSIIDELPPGRKPIQTKHVFENKRPAVYDFMKEEIAKGRQIYIVYPLIEESEQLDYKNLMEGYDHIQAWFPMPEYQTSIVHGKLKPDAKQFEMDRFVKGQTQIMVATTVIEVGVNVPNASVMIIESAERFGLSQLHQLRGRVGRGAEQSYCILITGHKLSREARIRMETMTSTSDGFKIAEVDLELRGPGDLQGTQQSGDLDLNIANLARDQGILTQCRELAREILTEDPELSMPQNAMIKQNLEALQKTAMDWARIS
jgi:ATP-dependent DNA helicase RecG